MSKYFEEEYSNTTTKPDCNSCGHYYSGTCDGELENCKSYYPTRYVRLEEMVKVGIGTTVLAAAAVIVILGLMIVFVR